MESNAAESKLIAWMKRFNHLIHILLAIALVVACVMVIWDFIVKSMAIFQAGNAASGFLHAFGSLFILWVLSTLISAEINYIQTGRVYVRVFVEVVIIALIREIIIHPMQAVSNAGGSEAAFDLIYYGLLLVALLVAGVVYRLVSNAGQAPDQSGSSES